MVSDISLWDYVAQSPYALERMEFAVWYGNKVGMGAPLFRPKAEWEHEFGMWSAAQEAMEIERKTEREKRF